MNEQAYHRMCEDAAYGEFLIEVLAEHLGCQKTAAAVDRQTYKDTVCGAYCKFDASGVVVGTIVEGSDAEYSQRLDLAGIDMSDEGAKLLAERYDAAIESCEAFVESSQK